PKTLRCAATSTAGAPPCLRSAYIRRTEPPRRSGRAASTPPSRPGPAASAVPAAARRSHCARTESQQSQENHGRGDVEQNRARDPAEPRPRLWKCQAEMQEHRGRQQAGHQVPEINHLIEVVELAGIVKAQRDEARQTQNIKVPGLVRAAPPEVDEQPDNE